MRVARRRPQAYRKRTSEGDAGRTRRVPSHGRARRSAHPAL